MSSADESAPSGRLSIIVPVYQGGEALGRSLPALLALLEDERVVELLVVDDCSTDGSAALATELGAVDVLATPSHSGPGAARNYAAERARGDALLFVDSDVVVHAGSAERLLQALDEPGVVAAFGSYDDDPPERGAVSLYMNLRHHLGHQTGRPEASTFWAGFGAVRREAFRQAGGFDAELYPRPMIEDIELGYRLRARGGRCRLVPEAACTHLKRWSLANAWRTDWSCRARPWSRLLLTHPFAAADLNVSKREKAKAILACAFLLSLPSPLLLGVSGLAIPATLLALSALSHRRLLELMLRRGGLRTAIAGLFLHEAHLVLATAAFAWTWLALQFGGERARA